MSAIVPLIIKIYNAVQQLIPFFCSIWDGGKGFKISTNVYTA